jgi:membrane protease YdiL (CAAX protease family)
VRKLARVSHALHTRGPTRELRFRLLESTAGDLPYYNGVPVRLSAPQWLFVLAALALGFAVLIWSGASFGGGVGRLIPALLFVALPLLALATVAGRHWRALFRPVGPRELVWMLGFALLNVLVSVGAAMIVRSLTTTAPNPAGALLESATVGERVAFFASTLPQLLGEELLTILPLLALLSLLHARLGWSRRRALLAAWLLSALLFALAHLSTYDWNLVQCVAVIGSARLVLTAAYIRTRNLWVSTGAHVLNDWLLLSVPLLLALVPAPS